MSENELATVIIGHAIDIHRALGPGLLEHVYQECLYYRLTKAGIMVRKEVPVPVFFEEIKMECGLPCRLNCCQ